MGGMSGYDDVDGQGDTSDEEKYYNVSNGNIR